MKDKQLFRELITPKSSVSSTRYGFITQLEIARNIVYAGILVEAVIVAYGLYKGNLSDLSNTIMTVAEAFGILSAVVSGFAFGGKATSKFAERPYAGNVPFQPIAEELKTDKKDTDPEAVAAAAESGKKFNEQQIR